MTPPRRQLGLGVTAAIVVANMIGVGVFTSTGFQAAGMHDPMTILVCWIVGGVIALCGAAAYAELGSMMPKAGGEYVYLREAYHPAVGFMSGWVSLTAGFSAPIAVAAITFAKYLGRVFTELAPARDAGNNAVLWAQHSFDLGSTHLFTVRFGIEQAIAIGLIVAIALLHSFDTKIGGWVQALFTAVKVVLIVLFILGGLLLGTGDTGHFAAQNGGLSNIGTMSFAISLMYVSFAYSGWNAAAYIASDVREPSRTLPRALLLGTGIVMVLYVLLNVVFLYAVPSDTLATGSDGGPIYEVGHAAAAALFGERVGQLVSSVISLALVSAVSAMIMAGPRVYAAMAADRALPRALAKHNDRGVPVFAVVTQAALASLFVIIGDPDMLIRFVGFTLAIFAALAVIAVYILRARGMVGAYRTFGYPITPVVFILSSVWIAFAQIKERPMESAVIGTILGLGGVVYYITTRGKPPIETENDPVDDPAELPSARVVDDK